MKRNKFNKLKYHLKSLYVAQLSADGYNYKAAEAAAEVLFKEFCEYYGIVSEFDASADANKNEESDTGDE